RRASPTSASAPTARSSSSWSGKKRRTKKKRKRRTSDALVAARRVAVLPQDREGGAEPSAGRIRRREGSRLLEVVRCGCGRGGQGEGRPRADRRPARRRASQNRGRAGLRAGAGQER